MTDIDDDDEWHLKVSAVMKIKKKRECGTIIKLIKIITEDFREARKNKISCRRFLIFENFFFVNSVTCDEIHEEDLEVVS